MKKLTEPEIYRRTDKFVEQFRDKPLEGEFDFFDAKALKEIRVKQQRYMQAAEMRGLERLNGDLFEYYYPDSVYTMFLKNEQRTV